MKVLFCSDGEKRPELSIILVDWSVRESQHAIDYLNRQSAPRSSYELIWIEYYSTRAPGLQERRKASILAGLPPALDQWIVLEMPESAYYHKHLLYNAGILRSRGRIVNICDSDAIFGPSYVDSIVSSFDQDREIVLHMDEIRTLSRSFYPFNHPSIEEVMESGPTNLVDGKPAGIVGPAGLPVEDRLHRANYGASMSALRADLITIGGADEHADYLGHVCGPYEMTFRLANLGKREIWHRREWIYHTWHPGQSGTSNCVGPHDGLDMSTTALRVRRSGRIFPLRENPGIRALREQATRPAIWASPFELGSAAGLAKEWSPEGHRSRDSAATGAVRRLLRHPGTGLMAGVRTLLDASSYGRLVSRVRNARPGQSADSGSSHLAAVGGKLLHLSRRVAVPVDLVQRVARFNLRLLQRCHRRLDGLRTERIEEIILFGAAALCGPLRTYSRDYGVQVLGTLAPGEVSERELTWLAGGVPILIATRYGIRWRRRWLLERGVDPDRILVIDDSWEDEEPDLAELTASGAEIDLALLLPTRGRPEIARAALDSIAQTVGDSERLEIILYLDEDDPSSHAIDHPGLQVRRVIGPPRVGMGVITNRCLLASRARYLMLGNDDMRMRTPGWDRRVVSASQRVPDGISLVYGNDGHQGKRLPTFPIISRDLAEALGGLACNRVNHFHIESHLFNIFWELRRLGEDRLLYLADVFIEHIPLPDKGRSPLRRQVLGSRDDRVTYCTLREERRQLAQLLLRRIRGEEAPPAVSQPSLRPTRPGPGYRRGAPRLTVLWLAPGDPRALARRLEDCGTDFRLYTLGREIVSSRIHIPADAAASTEAIVFLAPGVEPSPGWGTAVLAALQESPEVGALTGALILGRNGRLAQAGLWIERRPSGAVLIDRLRGLPAEDPVATRRIPVHAGSLLGLVLRRSALQQIGEFSGTLERPLETGIELCLRLAEKGLGVVYAPQLRWILSEDADSLDCVDPVALDERYSQVRLVDRPPEEPVPPTIDGLDILSASRHVFSQAQTSRRSTPGSDISSCST